MQLGQLNLAHSVRHSIWQTWLDVSIDIHASRHTYNILSVILNMDQPCWVIDFHKTYLVAYFAVNSA